MPQFDKLLTDVGPADPPARAAQRALKTRLRAVAYYLDRAAGTNDQEEQIHQLRIWTRRCTAALKLFAPLLPAKKSRRMKKTLRRIRQTAGAVRDLDVVEAQLGEMLHGPLSARLKKQRREADKALKRLVRTWGSKGELKRKSKRLIRHLDKRHHQANGVAFAAWCRMQLTPHTAEFAEFASRGPRQSDAQLHQWRLATKQLKYALELAVPALPKKAWSQLYALLGELQDRLGRICDAVLELQRLKEWRRETSDRQERNMLHKLGVACRKRQSLARQDLGKWWTRERSKASQALPRQAGSLESWRPSPRGAGNRRITRH